MLRPGRVTDESQIEHALILGTNNVLLLIVTVTEVRNAFLPLTIPLIRQQIQLADPSLLPCTYTANGVPYPVLGTISNDEPAFHVPEGRLRKYLQRHGTMAEYCFCDVVRQNADAEMDDRKAVARRDKRRAKRGREEN